MLDALAAAGLVLRARSTEDKRVVLTSHSDRGRIFVDERRARFEPRWQAALQQFGPDELLTAALVLDQVREMFDDLSDEK
jgi:DNA-binding MarR family transcriptional regulator